MGSADTIVALSSGALPSGVAVVRLSGPMAGAVLVEIIGHLPPPRRLILSDIVLDGDTLDRGLLAWMPGPNSFTGEDCAELQLHGSPAVVRAVLRKLACRHGLRLAEAGEFTRRAFENGKLNLVEAEGLGDLIAAETENQRMLAHARLEGGLTRQVEGWRERLLDLRAELEAQIDFADESDVGSLPEGFRDELLHLHADIARVAESAGQGRILRDGFRVVLAGPPNSGKSSLFNALSSSDAAIVSDEPGTTRDLKELPLDINGQLIVLIDSAGLRETGSQAEAIGVARARQAMQSADLVLWLQAPDQPVERPPLAVPEPGDQREGRPPVLVIGSKSDLGSVPGTDHRVSVATGEGLTALLDLLYRSSGASLVRAGELLVSRERDRIGLIDAAGAVRRAEGHLGSAEIAAEDLRLASTALERLLGRIDAEAVLDRLFSAFCIGK
ncbi:MAG: tRNA uridine-5-carboxymethylaminomethyl(34) synthesis GTPase MnmE [Devosia sp.]|nr:tRNA uridine-5-carboxymethylaminomethyl(34) synthesis GTPase MnmE [Devosia sp.]